MNVTSVRQNALKSDDGLRLFTSMRWPAATSVIHGTSEAFSTGSHAQKPPKLRASYAHAPPMRIPVPSTITPKKVHGSASFIHSVRSWRHRPAMAYAKGTSVAAKPRKSVGGWITIQ